MDASKRDSTVAALCWNITVTSMWRLPNGQQVAKVRLPRSAKPTEVSLVRIRHPKATRCFNCHGFGHSKGICFDPDMSDSCHKFGDQTYKERDCPCDKYVTCDRAELIFFPHRPRSVACGAKRAAELRRIGNRSHDKLHPNKSQLAPGHSTAHRPDGVSEER